MFSSKRNLILILIAATLLAYISSWGNPFIWDDEQFITSNQYVQRFDIGAIFTQNTIAGAGLLSNYYRPLTTLSFAVDHAIWGNNTFGFHLTNILFHIGAGLVLFLFLIELFGAEGSTGLVKPGAVLYPAFFISLIFLVHPIQTEAVTYINSRGDSLYTFFLFLSLFLFTKTLGSKGIHSTYYVLRNTCMIILFFILSLISKETALVGVGIFALVFILQILHHPGAKRSESIEVSQGKRFYQSFQFLHNDKIRKDLGTIGSLCLIAVVYFGLRYAILYNEDPNNLYISQNEYTKSIAIRLFTFCKVVWIYLGLLIWPQPLHMDRVVSLVKSFLSPWVIGLIGLGMGVVIGGGWQLKKGNPWILFGALWFLIMLVPGSGIIPINGMLYEHWLYVPLVGMLLTAYGLLLTAKNLLNTKHNTPGVLSSLKLRILNTSRSLLIAFLIGLAVIYMFLTIRQNNIWSDPITFYRYTLFFASDSARLHNNLGVSLANEGKIEEAIPEYKKAIFWDRNYMQPHYNLANSYVASARYTDAELEYQKALDLVPTYIPGRMNLLGMYIKQKQFNKALPQLIKLYPKFTDDYTFTFNYGYVLWNLGKRKEAEGKFTSALLLSNNNPRIQQAISNVKEGTY